MSDRAEDVARGVVEKFHVLNFARCFPGATHFLLDYYTEITTAEVNFQQFEIAAALRAYGEEERQWWVEALDADRPCVPAGTPKGSCRHTSQTACVLVAASRREREEGR